MTRNEFENLKVGEFVKIRRGHDKDLVCKVLYIECDSVLIKAPRGVFFKAINTNKRLRLTGWSELDILSSEKKEES